MPSRSKPETSNTANDPLATAKQRLGARIHGLRRDRGWTLDQAAVETGVSRASLSKIEKGQMSPTYDAMTKLAKGFELDVTALIPNETRAQKVAQTPLAQTPLAQTPLGRRSVTRAGEGRPYPSPNYVNALLAGDLSQKALLPFRTSVTARDLADFDEWHRHESEDFIYVLSGKMAFHSELYEPVTLEPGDSIYIDGRMGHAMVSLSPEDAVILWISAPHIAPKTEAH